MQRWKQEGENSKERKVRTPSEPLMARSRPESNMEAEQTHRAIGRFNFDPETQEQMSEIPETWTPPEPTPTLRDPELSRIKPLAVEVALPGLLPSFTGGSQISAGTSRLKELHLRFPESPASEGGGAPGKINR